MDVRCRFRYRFMCDNLERAASNRRMVKLKLYCECYPTDEELIRRGVKRVAPGVLPSTLGA